MSRLGVANSRLEMRSVAQSMRSYPWLKIIMPSVVLLAVLFASKVLMEKLQDPMAFPIKQVSVAGSFGYLDKNEVTTVVSSETYKGFFGIDLAALSERLKQVPWVQEAAIRRVWPDGLVVEIIERQAFAYWGQNGLVSVEGDAFFPNMAHVPANLPTLSGPLSTSREMTEVYRELAMLAQAKRLQIATLQLNDRHAWELVFDNGLKINIGREKGFERVNRFMDVYSQVIGDRVAEVDYVDLRYPNGFAVQWRTLDDNAAEQGQGL